MSFLDVPGARLHYEVSGDGPTLLCIGSPMDSTGFAPLVREMAGSHTVVTYDPRGLGRSTREDPDADITPQQQADDVHRLIESLGGGPVDCFGSSGGAVVGLALITAHPGDLRTLVAHEPPVRELLPDRVEVAAQFQEVYQTYLAQGVLPALGLFVRYAGLAQPSQDDFSNWQPSPEERARMEASNRVFLGHLLQQTTAFAPDLDLLRASPVRIVVGFGAVSTGQLPRRCAEALADGLGVVPVEFPGGHASFASQAAPEFAEQLRAVLAKA